MKTSLTRLAYLVITGLFLASCSRQSATPTFVMGLDDSFPPMGFRNADNEIVGYDVDLARAVCSRLGMKLKLQPIDWNAKEMELNSKKIDCIWNGFTITPERKEAMLFTPPYLKNAQVLVVRADSEYKTLADLAGKKIGTQAGSSGVDAIEKAPDFKASLGGVVEYKEYLTALMDLESKGIDAIVMDLIVAKDNIKRSGKPFQILDETLGGEEYGVGFRKDNFELMEKVWSTLLEMSKDGTVAKISEKWFSADISVIGK